MKAELEQIDLEIAALQERRKNLENPNREQVRRLYEDLDRILTQLGELGEDISDGDGFAITIVGTLFSYSAGEILEKKQQKGR